MVCKAHFRGDLRVQVIQGKFSAPPPSSSSVLSIKPLTTAAWQRCRAVMTALDTTLMAALATDWTKDFHSNLDKGSRATSVCRLWDKSDTAVCQRHRRQLDWTAAALGSGPQAFPGLSSWALENLHQWLIIDLILLPPKSCHWLKGSVYLISRKHTALNKGELKAVAASIYFDRLLFFFFFHKITHPILFCFV